MRIDFDLIPIRRSLRELGVIANDHWLREAIDHLSTMRRFNKDDPNAIIVPLVDLYLNCDIRESCEPSDTPIAKYSLGHKTYFSEHDSSMLQVESIVNIGVGEENREKRSMANRFLKILLSDGVGYIPALELSPIPGLSVDTPIGSKIAVKKSLVRRGSLMLDPTCARILGGEISLKERHEISTTLINPLEPMLQNQINSNSNISGNANSTRNSSSANSDRSNSTSTNNNNYSTLDRSVLPTSHDNLWPSTNANISINENNPKNYNSINSISSNKPHDVIVISDDPTPDKSLNNHDDDTDFDQYNQSPVIHMYDTSNEHEQYYDVNSDEALERQYEDMEFYDCNESVQPDSRSKVSLNNDYDSRNNGNNYSNGNNNYNGNNNNNVSSDNNSNNNGNSKSGNNGSNGNNDNNDNNDSGILTYFDENEVHYRERIVTDSFVEDTYANAHDRIIKNELHSVGAIHVPHEQQTLSKSSDKQAMPLPFSLAPLSAGSSTTMTRSPVSSKGQVSQESPILTKTNNWAVKTEVDDDNVFTMSEHVDFDSSASTSMVLHSIGELRHMAMETRNQRTMGSPVTGYVRCCAISILKFKFVDANSKNKKEKLYSVMLSVTDGVDSITVQIPSAVTEAFLHESPTDCNARLQALEKDACKLARKDIMMKFIHFQTIFEVQVSITNDSNTDNCKFDIISSVINDWSVSNDGNSKPTPLLDFCKNEIKKKLRLLSI